MEMPGLVRNLSLFLLLASAAFAAKADCGAAVTTQEAALRKADWVMEGTVEIIAEFPARKTPEVILDQTRVIQERGPSSVGKTVGISMGPCFPGGAAALLGKAGNQMTGQRMRFFGNWHSTDPTRRFFYAEPARTPLKPLRSQAGAVPLKSTLHGAGVEHRLPDGWHRATSTGGGFAVDLPGPYVDATVVKDKQTSFLLSARDPHGAMFIAAYQHSGPDSVLARTFDQSMAEPGSVATTFRGMPMFASRTPLPMAESGKLISHSYVLRVPGGTYMLGIATPKEHERDALRQLGRFMNSLQFE